MLRTDGQRTEATHGLLVVTVLSARHSLSGVEGTAPFIDLDRLLIVDRYSILPALALNGIIAVDIVEGSFNKIRFARFIDGLLDQMNPFPGPNSVIVMDNCRIHKCPEVLDMITERCALNFGN